MSSMKQTFLHPGAELDYQTLLSWMIEQRRWVHQHAELGFKEAQTSQFIEKQLQSLGVERIERIGDTAVIATISGREAAKPVAALRADMDGLPLNEETGLPYRSRNRGVMHACGHDGHVAMLLGAAAILQKKRPAGDVKCIFQPAEELATGAKYLVEQGVLDGVDGIFTGHIDTHFDSGVITVDEGIICAYADPFLIHIKGRGGHAAKPHETADAVVAASSLVTVIQTLVSRQVDPNYSAVVTVGRFQAGMAPNVIAEEAVLEGTIRSTHQLTREKTMNGLKRIVESIGDMYGVAATLHFSDGLPAVINKAEPCRIAREAALAVTDELLVTSQGKPSYGGEDFSFYQQVVPGCMVRFGGRLAGAGVAHSSTYNFDETALLFGAKWFADVAVRWQNR